jgi:putative sugar O-methyltransferase
VTGSSAPSEFWRELSATHRAQLRDHGLGEIKRQQALRYFTWQWQLRRLGKSEQMRFLLSKSPWPRLVRSLPLHQPLTRGLWAGLPWNALDRAVYSYAARLLWQYAADHGASDVLALGEPALGNPPPVLHKGRLISQDLANSALETTAIRRALGPDVPTSILEIGAGYGRTAFALMGVYPAARYTIVDIEPALSISHWYLMSLYPDRDITFLAADDATAEAIGAVDLAVSISSLQEMTHEQVAHYLDLIDQVVDGTVFLKQWRRWTNPVDGVVLDFGEYPVPEHWQPVFREPSPVQTAFDQAGWKSRRVDRG